MPGLVVFLVTLGIALWVIRPLRVDAAQPSKTPDSSGGGSPSAGGDGECCPSAPGDCG